MMLFTPIIPNIISIVGALVAMYICACLASIEKSSGELLRAIVEDSNVSNETIAALSGAYGVGSSSYNALLNSTGTISTHSSQYDYTAVGIVYVIFSYLWTTTFVQGILSLTISGAVAEWWVT